MIHDLHKPLAERMRPQSFEHFFGQDHLIKPAKNGKNPSGTLLKILESEILPSMIFWGPPGVGKTTLAQIIAQTTNREFYKLNAISSGVKDVREVIEKAKSGEFMGTYKKPIVFIDEIHRFNKSQQDSLLNAVERGIICLIGATTENPSFEVISALLSRCQVFTLKELSKSDLLNVIDFAIENDAWLKSKDVEIKENRALLMLSGGDARKLLNYLEIAVATADEDPKKKNKSSKIIITDEIVQEAIKHNLPNYDKNGEMHYDIISAFIKSIRGSDPQAAVYWLARMIEGGEDLKFISRRMLIAAAEDIGMANPNALLLAQTCFNAVSVIGYPESEIILSQTAIYLATSPKSNSSYQAIKKARQAVRETGDLLVPLHLRNAPTKLMKELGYGKDYKYTHDHPESIGKQEFLPPELKGIEFYKKTNNR